MPEILNRTKLSRVYNKADRYFVSSVQNGHLCRLVVDEDVAFTLVSTPADCLDSLVCDLLAVGRTEGSENYFEVKL